MLANPIYGGEWDDVLGMSAVVLALVVECAVVSRLLRSDDRVRGRSVLLALVNAISWPCFYAILPRVWTFGPPEGLALLLEVPVVMVEAGLIWLVGRTRLGPVLVASQRLTILRALVVVALGNLASLIAGYLFLALILKPRGLAIVLALTGAVVFVLSEFVQILMDTPTERRRSVRRGHSSRSR